MSQFDAPGDLLDFHPSTQSFHDAVVDGLRRREKTLPCKYFYDQTGSLLFDRICELGEYYVTRSELEIMRERADEMAEQIGTGVMLVEYGSGSSTKTRRLLRHLRSPSAYVPVDISKEHLCATADRLRAAFASIEVLPVCADFTCPFDLPTPVQPASHVAVYFPGSTIGNFTPDMAAKILDQIATQVGLGGGLLIGIDLQKPVDVLHAAYDDSQGVTAAFNLNLLSRIERELDADVDVQAFEHEAKYNDEFNRIEMRLISRVDQAIRVGDESFRLRRDEPITTEYSHKYTIDGFAELASMSGFAVHRSWTDSQNLFAVLHLVVEN